MAGERDPHKLAQLRDGRIRASEETIRKSLVGDYWEEHLFALRQSLQSYRHYQELIQEVDIQVKRMMQRLPSKAAAGQKPPKEKNPRKTPWRNEPPALRDDLYRAFGVAGRPRTGQPSPCGWLPKVCTEARVSWETISGG